MKIRIYHFESYFLWESTRGHYIELLPTIKIFPRRKTWNDGIITIHIGWLLWMWHWRIQTTEDTKKQEARLV